MKKPVLFFLTFLGVFFSASASAFQYAYAFHDPLFPTSSYRVEQDHKEYNSTYGKYHIGEDRNRGSCNDDDGDAVYSIANGLVTYAQNAGSSWGNVVIIRHIRTDFTRVHSLYGHLKNVYVSAGQEMTIGQQIGQVGNAGGYYPCAHLHLELRTDRTLEQDPGAGYAYWSDPIWNSHTDPSEFIANY